jgi:[protein-PII] uridylyltransferase
VDQQGHRPGENWSDLAQRGILTQAEARLIHHSDRQLQRLRIDLHILARRREDRLIFDLQQSMGLAFGLQDTPAKRASEQVMQLYFRAAKTVSQLNGILLPNLRPPVFAGAAHHAEPERALLLGQRHAGHSPA